MVLYAKTMLIVLILIFSVNVVYVAMNTLRVILVMKGYRFIAALLSTTEVLIYLIGLNIVLADIYNPLNLTVYCIGWGSGVYLGSKIEQHLALGYVSYQIFLGHYVSGLTDILRDHKFGVTYWVAEGKDGPRQVLHIVTLRKREAELLGLLKKFDRKVFYISYELSSAQNGFLSKKWGH